MNTCLTAMNDSSSQALGKAKIMGSPILYSILKLSVGKTLSRLTKQLYFRGGISAQKVCNSAEISRQI